jgi:hypothetical protein
MQITRACDPVRFEKLESGFEGFGAAQMRTVGSRAGDQVGPVSEQQRAISTLHRGSHSFHLPDQTTFIAARQSEQYRSNVRRTEGGVKRARQKSRVVNSFRDDVKAGWRTSAVGLRPDCHPALHAASFGRNDGICS